MMKKSLWLAVMCAIVMSASAAFAAYPDKPIKIVNYVGPGGLMDVTSRKFIAVAQKYTDATFVVENKEGAGGLIGIEAVLEQPADGYTVFAPTTSVILKVLTSNKDIDQYIWSFEWIAMLMRDPECLIGSVKNPVHVWADVVKDAREKNGAQIWTGPAAGGNDHIMAMKTWAVAGIKGKYVPYKSGPEAMLGVLGGQGVVYVGNPADIGGREGFNIIAVSSKERLKVFPDAPTFGELGLTGMDDETMWRGFCVKKGTPEEAMVWWENLLKKVAADPEWRSYLEADGIEVVDWGREKFTEQVKKDVEDSLLYLKEYGIIK
ncbi:MAG: tripartite tricarboxylate transporter substrate binding protein [Synergistaceae bacterium]|jgi:tripartite-type tricarboxylate transporter receptor subunit TctC|nr:tripartite tricarboxylate transporter substrate binding protein [Synergistaceae bacterium]